MRILFWGTPAFAVPSLRALDDEGFDVVSVVTQPDRPAGRGRRVTPSPVRTVAEELGLPVLTPERPKGDEFLAQIGALAPDISVVVAYGHILASSVLEVPRLGSINVHASLLPELRGAAPIHWAIIRGHTKTGITIIRMVPGMDAGPMLHRAEEPILPDETSSELSVRLSEIGAAVLVEALALLSSGAIEPEEQDHARVTFAPKLDRDSARIDWNRPAREVANLIRGLDEVPGAWTTLDGESLKLFRPTALDIAARPPSRGGEALEAGTGTPPGTVISVDGGIHVAAGSGALSIEEVQPSGRRRMRTADWVRGSHIAPGRRFE